MTAKSLSLIVLIAFTALAVFGFAVMAYEMSHGADCLATAVAGRACVETGVLAILDFHADAIKFFSTAILLCFLLLSIFYFVFYRPLNRPVFQTFPSWSLPFFAPGFGYLNFWLSLHENSPNR